MIGLGLWNAKDISVKALEIVRSCDFVYLETYTSRLGCDISEMEELYGKKIILANRELVEGDSDEILKKEKDVAFLIMGDVFAATTHVDLRKRAVLHGIKVVVLHNASVLTAVGETGLELYKFGKTTSIPFENENVLSPVDVLNMNRKNGLHTLFLLDLRPDEDRFMSVKEACEYLLKHTDDYMAVGCAGLGSDAPEIKYAKLSEMEGFSLIPQCLIIPGNLHFMEEESLAGFKK